MNKITQHDGFYISYNPTSYGYNSLQTTALVSSNGLREFFYILNGNHEAAWNEAARKGWNYAVSYYTAFPELWHEYSDKELCPPCNRYTPDKARSAINRRVVRAFFTGTPMREGLTEVQNKKHITSLFVDNSLIAQRKLFETRISVWLPVGASMTMRNRLDGILKALNVTGAVVQGKYNIISLITGVISCEE